MGVRSKQRMLRGVITRLTGRFLSTKPTQCGLSSPCHTNLTGASPPSWQHLTSRQAMPVSSSQGALL